MKADDSLHEAARAEAARMREAAAAAGADGEVRMSVAHFARLAELVARLADTAPEPEVFGDTRYWVPLAHFIRLKAQHEALQRLASCGALGFADLVGSAPTGADVPKAA